MDNKYACNIDAYLCIFYAPILHAYFSYDGQDYLNNL